MTHVINVPRLRPDEPDTLHKFNKTHNIETVHRIGYGWEAAHIPTKEIAFGATERIAVITLCNNLNFLEFPR
jgi:hypothetical protein